MTKIPSDDFYENEEFEKLRAELTQRKAKEIMRERKKAEGKEFMRCPICGQGGYSGEYPFSTCPPNCDDCS